MELKSITKPKNIKIKIKTKIRHFNLKEKLYHKLIQI